MVESKKERSEFAVDHIRVVEICLRRKRSNIPVMLDLYWILIRNLNIWIYQITEFEMSGTINKNSRLPKMGRAWRKYNEPKYKIGIW